jgi:hypothetical protein
VVPDSIGARTMELPTQCNRRGLKTEKCFWYMLDYECKNREWTYVVMVPRELVITNPNGTKSPILQEDVTVSKKTLGIHDSPAGGNASHLMYIKEKATQWVT